MSRPTSICNKDILKAARRLFLENGCSATTAELAQRIGVSEGTIFKRFSTKKELFVAAMAVDERLDWKPHLESLVGQGDLRENLVSLLSDLAAMFQDLLPRVMLLWSERGGAASKLDALLEPGSLRHRMVGAFTDYLDQEMRIGRLRRSSPAVTSQLLTGAVWNVAFHKVIWKSTASSDSDDQVVGSIRVLVETMWHGIAPDVSD